MFGIYEMSFHNTFAIRIATARTDEYSIRRTAHLFVQCDRPSSYHISHFDILSNTKLRIELIPFFVVCCIGHLHIQTD